MTEPWADLRRVTMIEDLGLPASSLIMVRKLLHDADALLAVARDDMTQAYDEWLDLAKVEKAEFFNDWLEHTHPLLAALPEHLRGDNQ